MARTVVKELVAKFRGDTRGLEKSTKTAKKAIKDVGEETKRSARKMQFSFGSLTRYIGPVAAGFAALKAVNISDTFTEISTKLQNVTKDQIEYNAVLRDLTSIAQENGDSIEGLASTYTKLSVSLPDAVRDTTDLVKVTELLSRGFAANATSASTAAGATLQLTQGLATDFKAAGQELNSIIEGAPLLAKIIATELGGSAATDLKRFAREGKLTAETFLTALVNSEEAIKSFEIPPTINRSVQRIKNELVLFTGTVTEATKVNTGLASSLDGISNALGFMSDKIKDADRNLTAWINTYKVSRGKLIQSPIPEIGFNEFRAQVKGADKDLSNLNMTLDSSILFKAPSPGQKPQLADEDMFDFVERQRKRNEKMAEEATDARKKQIEKVAKAAKKANDQYKRSVEGVKSAIEDQNRALQATRNEMADLFSEGITGWGDLKRVAISAIQDIARNMLRLSFGGTSGGGIGGSIASSLFSALGGSIGGIAGFSGIASASSRSAGQLGAAAAGGAFAPGLASGGSFVVRGNSGIDRNMLSLNGQPIANVAKGETVAVKKAGGGGTTVNQTINVTTGIQQTVRAEIQRFLPQFESIAVQATQGARQRGKV